LAAKAPPKSVTFILATLEDNKILQENDPGYIANLMAMTYVDRERLLGGNWKVRNAAGTTFKREWLTNFVDDVPPDRYGTRKVVRYWDQAGSTEGDESAGGLIIEQDNNIYLADLVCGKWEWEERNNIIEATAEQDLLLY